MSNIKKVIYSGREFVNRDGEDDTGYIQAHIKWEYNYGYEEYDSEDDNSGYPGHVEYMLKFADCNRIIDFNIRGDNPQERDNARHKIDKMIEVLNGFKNALDEAFEIEDTIKAHHKEEKKKAEEKKKENESG